MRTKERDPHEYKIIKNIEITVHIIGGLTETSEGRLFYTDGKLTEVEFSIDNDRLGKYFGGFGDYYNGNNISIFAKNRDISISYHYYCVKGIDITIGVNKFVFRIKLGEK